MTKLIDIEGKEKFDSEVIKSPIPVLVDFWAPWCGPCQMMAPILDEMAKKFEGRLKVVKINTENRGNQQLAAEYRILSIPNMKLFKQGKVIKDFIGFRPFETFSVELETYLKYNK